MDYTKEVLEMKFMFISQSKTPHIVASELRDEIKNGKYNKIINEETVDDFRKIQWSFLSEVFVYLLIFILGLVYCLWLMCFDYVQIIASILLFFWVYKCFIVLSQIFEAYREMKKTVDLMVHIFNYENYWFKVKISSNE